MLRACRLLLRTGPVSVGKKTMTGSGGNSWSTPYVPDVSLMLALGILLWISSKIERVRQGWGGHVTAVNTYKPPMPAEPSLTYATGNAGYASQVEADAAEQSGETNAAAA
eukprot:TRINITY_DN569_c0_g1_i5.p1 TRINITY_DN569_c0_g1~~TRINITY_DN569_c0_g1_i5.p1  ORF type:complete len:110 (+),score=14.14 TRINITY_DN569_c0_g1_i5:216-545(+)